MATDLPVDLRNQANGLGQYRPQTEAELILDATRDLASGARNRMRAGMRATSRATAQAGLLGYTGSTTMIGSFPAVAARLIAENICATPTVGFAASIAASANLTGGDTVPTGTPSAFTWGGAANVALPAAVSGGGTTEAVASLTASDVVPYETLLRDDGGLGFLNMVRDYCPAAGNTETSRVDSVNGPLATLGAICYASGTAYNGAVWPALGGLLAGIARSWSLELITATLGKRLLLAGDSTFQGALAGNDTNSAATIAMLQLLVEGIRMSVVNRGSASMTSGTYFINGVNYMTFVPGVTHAALCGFSPNDPDKYTAAGTARQKSLLYRWVGECVDRRVEPILATPSPVGGLNAAQEGYRRDVAVTTRALAISLGVPCIDRDAVQTDYGTSSGGWKAGMATNLVHANQTGYLAEAVEWNRVMRLIA